MATNSKRHIPPSLKRLVLSGVSAMAALLCFVGYGRSMHDSLGGIRGGSIQKCSKSRPKVFASLWGYFGFSLTSALAVRDARHVIGDRDHGAIRRIAGTVLRPTTEQVLQLFAHAERHTPHVDTLEF
jgi:hypothetical protein